MTPALMFVKVIPRLADAADETRMNPTPMPR